MRKPSYELAPLRLAVTQHHTNILAFQKAIEKEQHGIDECQGYIREWEAYNRGGDGDSSKPDSES